MTSPISNNQKRRAFTLIELLVVIGIIGLLIAILLPAVQKAIAAGKKAKLNSDLNVIAMALDQYRQDFRDYPRLATNQLDAETKASNLPLRKYGGDLLVRSLIAPFNRNPSGIMTAVTDQDNQIIYNVQNTKDDKSNFDGADGPGFRIRRELDPRGDQRNADQNDTCQGEVKGPYIAANKFKWQWDDSNLSSIIPAIPANAPPRLELLDSNDNPILYYPASQQKVDIRAYFQSSIQSSKEGQYVHYGDVAAKFDSRYGDYKLVNGGSTRQNRLKLLRLMLGDADADGRINDDEIPIATTDFFLYSAGLDGSYGFEIANTDTPEILRLKRRKCDDVIFAKQ